MAKKRNGVDKSAEIRQLLRTNPQMPVKEIVSSLAAKGITVSENWVYFIKGKRRGRKARRTKARQMVARVTATGNSDPVAAILKVKHLAAEVGGLKKLRALVEALGD